MTYRTHEDEEVGEVGNYGAEVGLCDTLRCRIPLLCCQHIAYPK